MDRDMRARGMPDPSILDGNAPPLWTATIHDLLSAYARQRQKQARSRMTLHKRVVWSLAEARSALARIVGEAADWSVLDGFLIAYCATPELRRTVRASSLSATLEMVKEGRLAMRQDAAFAPLWIKSLPGRPRVVEVT